VKNLADLYAQQFKTTIASQFQYRGALVIWLIGHMLEPLVYLVVWSAVARSSGGVVGGYDAGRFASYFIVMMLVNHLTFTWIMYEFDYRVRHGSLSFALLRPVHPIHSDLADNLSFKLLTLPVMLATAALLWVAFKPELRIVPWAVLASVPALALAIAVRFLVEWTLALSAFWITRASAVNQMYFVAALFLSGQAAPLPLLPFPARAAAAVLPFRWTVGFPVELLTGRLNPSAALIGLGAQSLWLVLSLAILKIVWRAGVRAYSAVGA
jgi:viologen exporter family transport system permease protein